MTVSCSRAMATTRTRIPFSRSAPPRRPCVAPPRAQTVIRFVPRIDIDERGGFRIHGNGELERKVAFPPPGGPPTDSVRQHSQIQAERRPRRSASVLWEQRSPARAAGGGYADAVRRARRRALPSEPHRRSRSCLRAVTRRDCRSRTRCREEIRSTRRYQSESLRTTGPQLAEITLPTRPTETPGFFDPEGFHRQGSKCKVNRRALRPQVVTAHDLRAGCIVDIHIGA